MYSSCATHPKTSTCTFEQRASERVGKRENARYHRRNDENNADSNHPKAEWMNVCFDVRKAAETFEPNIISRNINFQAFHSRVVCFSLSFFFFRFFPLLRPMFFSLFIFFLISYYMAVYHLSRVRRHKHVLNVTRWVPHFIWYAFPPLVTWCLLYFVYMTLGLEFIGRTLFLLQ